MQYTLLGGSHHQEIVDVPDHHDRVQFASYRHAFDLRKPFGGSPERVQTDLITYHRIRIHLGDASREVMVANDKAEQQKILDSMITHADPCHDKHLTVYREAFKRLTDHPHGPLYDHLTYEIKRAISYHGFDDLTVSDFLEE